MASGEDGDAIRIWEEDTEDTLTRRVEWIVNGDLVEILDACVAGMNTDEAEPTKPIIFFWLMG